MGYAYYDGARRATPISCSIFDGLTLRPLPYPVLMILTIIFVFLGISWYSSYEEAVETVEEGINWFLILIPISIVFAVKWLSSTDNSQSCKYYVDYRRPPPNYCVPPPQGGGVSPWAVASLIILLLLLVQYQS